jgi:excisionase family DNA binding protein
MSALGDWLTIREAAELTGYNQAHIRRLLRQGKIACQKFGVVWMVEKPDLLRYVAEEGRGPMEKKGIDSEKL